MVTDEWKKLQSKKYRDTHKEEIAVSKKKYKENNKEKVGAAAKRRNVKLKKTAFSKISEFHKTDISCWRCGEMQTEKLTIGHINNDGNEDRKQFKSQSLYVAIKDGVRTCADLRLECYNCNLCKAFYGKYPDEIEEKEFIY